MHRCLAWFSALSLALGLFSCEFFGGGETTDPDSRLSVNDFSPKEGPAGTLVKVTGEDLKRSDDNSRVLLSFGGVEAEITKVSEKELTVKVPNIPENKRNTQNLYEVKAYARKDVLTADKDKDYEKVFSDKFRLSVDAKRPPNTPSNPPSNTPVIITQPSTPTQVLVSDGSSPEELYVAEAASIKGLLKLLGSSSMAAALGVDGATINALAEKFLNNVHVYRIKYRTTYKNNEVIASAVVSIPRTSGTYPLLSIQHATITKNDDAPSVYLKENKSAGENPTALFLSGQGSGLSEGLLHLLNSYMAMAGYVVVVPDYIGFGESRSTFHPYLIADVSARTVVDALKAAKEAVRSFDERVTESVTASDKVYLVGYSEGGYVTMATQKHLTSTAEGFSLQLVAAGAGGYDLEALSKQVLAQTSYPQPFFIGYIFLAYKRTYNWTEGPDYLFQSAYEGKIEGLYGAERDLRGAEINTELTTTLSELLKPEVITAFAADDAQGQGVYKKLIDKLGENSLKDGWTPTAKLLMYHGTVDTYIPIKTSRDVATALKSRAGDKVSLQEITGKGHVNAAPVFFFKAWEAVTTHTSPPAN